MLNGFSKTLLVATSLSPVLGAVAVNQIALGKSWHAWSPWLAAAVLLAVICLLMIKYAAKTLQRQIVKVESFESSDKEILAFLVTYLLPFISSKDMAFQGQWLTGAYILGVIFVVIAHSGAFHFNPVMGLLGYHFYGIKNTEGTSQLLISKKELDRKGIEIQSVKLATGIYLNTGD